MDIKSPLINSTNIKFKHSVRTNFIINKWQELSIDVTRFFVNLDEIYLYECLDTGYKFYYPFNLEGDDQFYRDLQKFPWYYMDWKWEYEEARKLIKPGEKVLEIGCGKGDFIEKLKNINADTTGLEFNEEAIKKCQAKGLKVFKETIQQHALNNQKIYDYVCSFQVMEHVANIGEALQASITVLKNGGKLIISVPNNNSFIKRDEFNLLNMPPHHLGRWDEKSFKNLEKIFNIKLKKIKIEPLQDYHYRYYYRAVLGNRIERIFGPFGKFLNLILERISLYLMVHTNLPQHIKGHTIMAVYQKHA